MLTNINTVSTWPRMFLIASLLVLAYSFVLPAQFKVLDDQVTIIDNEDIKSLSNFKKIFTASFFQGNTYYRPLVSLSFMLEYRFFKLNPFFYNLDNLLIHLLVVAAVWLLLNQLLKDSNTSFYITLFYVIHPIHWEAVGNIPGRAILLCGLFYLLSFYLFVKFIRQKNIFVYVCSLFFFVLALLSKESAVTLPATLLLYLLFFQMKGRGDVPKIAWIIPYFVILFLYLGFRKSMSLDNYVYWPNLSVSLLAFSTFLRGVLTYLRVMVLPVDLHFDRARPLYMSFVQIEIFLVWIVFIALSALILLNRSKIPKPVLFFLSWFFIDLIPVSQILLAVQIQTGYIALSEHFLYTASIGLLGVLVIGFQKISTDAINRKIISSDGRRTLVSGFFLFLYLTTVQQNIYASQELAMFKQTLQYAPYNTRIRNSYALALAKLKLIQEAQNEFRKVLGYDPLNVHARIGLGKTLCDQGKYLQCLDEYHKVYDAGDSSVTLTKNLCLTYRILIDKYQEVIKKNPNEARALYSLGVMYAKSNKYTDAIDAFKKACEIDPSLKEAVFNLATTYMLDNQFDKSVEFYLKTLEIPAESAQLDIQALLYLARGYKDRGNDQKAGEYQQRADALMEKSKVP